MVFISFWLIFTFLLIDLYQGEDIRKKTEEVQDNDKILKLFRINSYRYVM